MTTSAPTVSAVLIVKDEEDVLASALESVRWADQVVVYDTGSTDGTLEIARRLADTVVEGYWDDDFGAARNRAIEHATSAWVLVLDADETFEGDPDTVRQHLGRGDALAHRVVVDSNMVDGHGIFGGSRSVLQSASVRLFVRGAYRYEGRIHELPVAQVPDATRATTLLHGVLLRHSGYAATSQEMQAKGDRNLAIAEADLASAIDGGASALEVEWRRVQVIRSLALAGRRRDALEAAKAMAREGFLAPRRAVVLARAMVDWAEQLEGRESADAWLDLWERNDLNPTAARLHRAKIAASRGDAAAALDAIEALPTTSVNSLGERVDRVEVVAVEVWALARTGRSRRAVQVARAAATRGVTPGLPAVLAEVLGAERCAQVLEVATAAVWRELVTACLLNPVPAAREFLGWMHESRPGDATVLAAAVHATPHLTLEEATRWSVAMRSAGAADLCPLVHRSLDGDLDPAERALAGALAYSAFQDERALGGLEAALALVPREQEADLLGQLEVVAPGLVSPNVPA